MNENVKITTVAVIYAGLLGVCYLEGFWNVFNINVFQYADLMDVLKATILPLTLTLFGTAFGFLSGVGLHIATPSENAPPAPESRTARIIATLKKNGPVIYSLWTLAAIFSFYLAPAPYKWNLLSIFSSPLGLLIINTKIITSITTRVGLRAAIAVMLVSLPFLSLSHGSDEAIAITSGSAKYMVDINTLKMVKEVHAVTPVEYIGFIGSTFFLYDVSSKGLILIKQSDSTVLSLIPNPKARQTL